jgi:hypothetical protein
MSHIYRLIFALPALICLHFACLPAISQDKAFVKFEVPSDKICLILFHDPDSPLKLYGPVKVIGYSYGGLSFGYTIANRSNANIASFEIQQIDWFHEMGYSSGSPIRPRITFYPGLEHFMLDSEDTEDLSPFDASNESDKKVLTLSSRYWVAMVTKVKLSDGTTYDASKKFAILEQYTRDNWDYFSNRSNDSQVGNETRQKDVDTKGTEFRAFLERLAQQRN